jgi:TonB family protein
MSRILLAIGFAALVLHAQPPASIKAPALIARCQPRYTEAVRAAKVQGTVLLRIEVGADGRAHSVRVIRHLGHGLDERAIEAVRQWRFLPGEKDGRRVRVPATIEVVFRLNDTGEPCRAEVLRASA